MKHNNEIRLKNVNHTARQVGKTQMNDAFFNAFLNSQRPLHSLTKKEFDELKRVVEAMTNELSA